MSKPVLAYFNVAARAELCRLALHSAGIEFEDQRFTWEGKEFADFKADKENGSGKFFGYAPVFFSGNFSLCQSPAIALYVNDKMFPGLTPEQRAIDAMYAMVHYDMSEAAYKMLFGDDASKAKGKTEFTDSVNRHLEAFEERLVPEAGFIHGFDKPSLADLAVHDIIYSPTTGVTTLKVDASKYQKVLGLCNRVAAFPPIKKYLDSESRPTE